MVFSAKYSQVPTPTNEITGNTTFVIKISIKGKKWGQFNLVNHVKTGEICIVEVEKCFMIDRMGFWVRKIVWGQVSKVFYYYYYP